MPVCALGPPFPPTHKAGALLDRQLPPPMSLCLQSRQALPPWLSPRLAPASAAWSTPALSPSQGLQRAVAPCALLHLAHVGKLPAADTSIFTSAETAARRSTWRRTWASRPRPQMRPTRWRRRSSWPAWPTAAPTWPSWSAPPRAWTLAGAGRAHSPT